MACCGACQQSRSWNGKQLVVFVGIARSFEHVQHPLGDGETPSNVDGGSCHRGRRQDLPMYCQGLQDGVITSVLMLHLILQDQ